MDLHRRPNDWEVGEMVNLMELIDHVHPNQEVDDTMCWLYNNNSIFTMKSLKESQWPRTLPSPVWRRVWKLCIPSKVSFFLWLYCQMFVLCIIMMQKELITFSFIALLLMRSGLSFVERLGYHGSLPGGWMCFSYLGIFGGFPRKVKSFGTWCVLLCVGQFGWSETKGSSRTKGNWLSVSTPRLRNLLVFRV